MTAEAPSALTEDDRHQTTWRARVTASLADTVFGVIQLDISPRAYELHATDKLGAMMLGG